MGMAELLSEGPNPTNRQCTGQRKSDNEKNKNIVGGARYMDMMQYADKENNAKRKSGETTIKLMYLDDDAQWSAG